MLPCPNRTFSTTSVPTPTRTGSAKGNYIGVEEVDDVGQTKTQVPPGSSNLPDGKLVTGLESADDGRKGMIVPQRACGEAHKRFFYLTFHGDG